jgi:hypothetical protein
MSISTLKLGVAMTAIVALLAAAIVTADSASAGKGGGGKPGGGGASITLNQADPHLGDWVTFTTSGSGSNIQVACYWGLDLVWESKQRVGSAFLLGGTNSRWLSDGGSADCYAWLIGRDMNRIYASTRFAAGGAR